MSRYRNVMSISISPRIRTTGVMFPVLHYITKYWGVSIIWSSPLETNCSRRCFQNSKVSWRFWRLCWNGILYTTVIINKVENTAFIVYISYYLGQPNERNDRIGRKDLMLDSGKHQNLFCQRVQLQAHSSNLPHFVFLIYSF